jgi:IS30 family transposase
VAASALPQATSPPSSLWHTATAPTLSWATHRRATGHRGDSQAGGDWEGDTIVGKGLARVVTLVDRKSGLLRMRLVPNGEADTVMRAIVHALHPQQARVHTLTWDDGSEFAEHALVDIALTARSYFAEPYSSWQRGINENTNGLIRQYLPKRCDLSAYSDADIQAIEDKLN